MTTVSEKMQVHSETVGKAVQQTVEKSTKIGRRIPGHLPTLLIIFYDPQNELRLHCSRSGLGTHQRLELQLCQTKTIL